MSKHCLPESRPRVLVTQRVVPHYRVRFWQLVSTHLGSRGIELIVTHGRESPRSAPIDIGKGRLGIPGERWAPNRYLKLGSAEFIIQRNAPHTDGVDLIIVEQASRMYFTWRCMLRHHLGRGPRVALWGHGRSWQGSKASIGEAAKRLLLREAHFWFAYTEGVADELRDIPSERIVNVNNSIDTRSLAEDLEAVRQQGAQRIPGRLAFIGSMRKDKLLDLLCRSADIAQQSVPGLSIVFIGDGPEQAKIVAYCAKRSWARYLGPLFGREKAEALAEAQCVVNPGLVGLNIIDSFVAEAPLITTDYPGHSPEIAYLEDEANGLMTQCSPATYADILVRALTDQHLMTRLRNGCRISASRYSIEQMAFNFALGVIRALALPPASRRAKPAIRQRSVA